MKGVIVWLADDTYLSRFHIVSRKYYKDTSIQNPVKYLRWSALRKKLTAESR